MDEASAAAAPESATVFPEERLPAAVPGVALAEAETAGAGGIFGKLVTADDDIVGLVAYALYKQNKIEWMRAFERGQGCKPNDDEFAAYIVGENTSRRVATYRFLAESTIERSASAGKLGVAAPHNSLVSATLNVFYGLVGVAAVAAVIVLLRFFISLKH